MKRNPIPYLDFIVVCAERDEVEWKLGNCWREGVGRKNAASTNTAGGYCQIFRSVVNRMTFCSLQPYASEEAVSYPIPYP